MNWAHGESRRFPCSPDAGGPSTNGCRAAAVSASFPLGSRRHCSSARLACGSGVRTSTQRSIAIDARGRQKLRKVRWKARETFLSGPHRRGKSRTSTYASTAQRCPIASTDPRIGYAGSARQNCSTWNILLSGAVNVGRLSPPQFPAKFPALESSY